jgi:hypothetical protein
VSVEVVFSQPLFDCTDVVALEETCKGNVRVAVGCESAFGAVIEVEGDFIGGAAGARGPEPGLSVTFSQPLFGRIGAIGVVFGMERTWDCSSCGRDWSVFGRAEVVSAEDAKLFFVFSVWLSISVGVSLTGAVH